MDQQRLQELVTLFYQEMQNSTLLQDHIEDHRRRSERVHRLLTTQHIPQLTENELRELFFDSDAFGFWGNKEWEFNDRLQKTGLEEMHNILLELITRAEQGLKPEDLRAIWEMKGLGTLLSTEFLAYRYPDRYWTYSANVTLSALQKLGDNVRDQMPRGQKSDAYLYFALESRLAEIRSALQKVGLPNVDNLVADIFLWWVNKKEKMPSLPTNETPKNIGRHSATNLPVSPRQIWLFQANPKYFDLVAALSKAQPGETVDWTVTTHRDEMQAGDIVVLWQSGSQGGICGIAELINEPYQRKSTPNETELKEKPYRKADWWVDLRILTTLVTPISRSEAKANPALQNLGVLKFSQGTNYPVLPEEWQEIRQLIQQKSAPLDTDNVKQLIEALFPDPQTRFSCLQVMADTIQRAHTINPAVWETTLYHNRIRLNVGKVEICVFYADEVYLVLDVEAMPAQQRREVEGRGQSFEQSYNTVPGARGMRFRASELAKWLTVIQPAFNSMVDKAAHKVKRTPFYKAHSPEVVSYLRVTLGRDLPNPNYNTTTVIQEVLSLNFELADVLTSHIACQDLYFTPWQITTFYTALQTKGFVILSGISGTGKTKLAQAFADALPQPAQREIALADDVIAVTVQPYMRKYGRLIIPKQATRLFDPPPPGESQDVTLRFENTSQVCRFVHASYGNSDYLSLLFRGKARQWFVNTFAEGDTVILQPELNKEDTLAGFQIGTLETIATQTPTKPAGDGQRNVLFVPVRTDWRDSKSLLGYYNPLTGMYEWTPFLRFLLRVVQSYRARDGLAWFVILDEMNLARVEYYFADLLSILESGRTAEGWTREPLRLSYPDTAEGDLPPKELPLPPNIYVVGTVNVDETTHAFSPKVLDRAFTLELTDADFSRYPATTPTPITDLNDTQRQTLLQTFTNNGAFARIDKAEIAAYVADHPDAREHLRALNALLHPYDMHFGYRVFDEIIAFLLNAEHNSLYDTLSGDDPAFDAAVLMKVLPKFHGSRGKLEQPLKQVLAWCLDPDAPSEETITDTFKDLETGGEVAQTLANLNYRYPRTATRVQRMLWALYTSGFAAFG